MRLILDILFRYIAVSVLLKCEREISKKISRLNFVEKVSPLSLSVKKSTGKKGVACCGKEKPLRRIIAGGVCFVFLLADHLALCLTRGGGTLALYRCPASTFAGLSLIMHHPQVVPQEVLHDPPPTGLVELTEKPDLMPASIKSTLMLPHAASKLLSTRNFSPS